MTTPPNESIIQGDPFGVIKQEKGQESPPPGQVNALHTRDDVDSGQLAHHHTCGIGHNQASPGDHVHDGISSRKIGTGLSLTFTGSRGGNAAVASIIATLKQVMEVTDSTTP